MARFKYSANWNDSSYDAVERSLLNGIQLGSALGVDNMVCFTSCIATVTTILAKHNIHNVVPTYKAVGKVAFDLLGVY